MQPPAKVGARPRSSWSKHIAPAQPSLPELFTPGDELLLPQLAELAVPGNACTGIDCLPHDRMLNSVFSVTTYKMNGWASPVP